MTTLDHYEFLQTLYFRTTNTSYGKVHRKKALLLPARILSLIPFEAFLACILRFFLGIFGHHQHVLPFMAEFRGLPFVGVGIYLLFRTLLSSPSCLRNKTFYHHHQQKLIIRSGSKIQSIRQRIFPPMGHPSPQNGNGTILFWQESYHRNGREILLPFLRWKILQMLPVRRTRSSLMESKWEKTMGENVAIRACSPVM